MNNHSGGPPLSEKNQKHIKFEDEYDE